MMLDKRSFARLFPGFTDDSAQQATLSVGQPGMELYKSVDVARPAHLRALIVVRDKIRDAQDVVVEAASAASLGTLDNSEKLAAHHFLQKAAQVAEEPWQQIIHGHSGPSTAKSSMSQLEVEDSTCRNYRHNCLGFMTEPGCGAHKAPYWLRKRGTKLRELKICATRMSVINGFITRTPV